MSEFNLFNQAIEEYNKTQNVISRASVDTEINDESTCGHTNVITEKGVSVCIDCGEELDQHVLHSKDWRTYDVGSFNRTQMRKNEERSIFKDVENLSFSESIIAKANKIYSDVTEGKIFRGNHRRAIVFACVFHAFKLCGKPQSHEKLIQIFNLSRKIGLRGLKYVNLYASKDSKIRTTYISPVHIVEEIMEKFSATKEQVAEVLELYEKIKNKSSRLNRSRPQSVASGLVFYWITTKGKNISLKEFAKKVILSELTINRISKEITEVLERRSD